MEKGGKSMPRAGGSSSSSSRSSSSHSMSRSSGGHSVSSSYRSSSSGSRAGSGRSNSGSGSMFSSRRTPPPPPPPRRVYGSSYYSSPRTVTHVYTDGAGYIVSTIITWIIVLLIVVAMIWVSANKDTNGVTSTVQRIKLDYPGGYINNCITDELGWFSNESKTETELKYFYDKTGVQPMIILKNYDSSLVTEEDKIAWTEKYYEDNFTQENIFLYVYFAEEDTDNDVGYMTYTNGYGTSSVMDSEAVDIFWSYIDRYWYTDMTTDEVFLETFKNTADVIMKSATAKQDTVKWVVIGVTVIGGGLITVVIMKLKRKHDREKAEETERILNTPLETLSDNDNDDLIDKYS